ncbi:HEXXH motif-containing putative peptide modification protein [Sulfobacillus sp. hq2]|uniref:aKG-HExxH-type peptide beta-hydroxylase n=1 Tax=Sulfobacillus TaxID=28033 RepID=UPI000CD20BB5|nr:HEXXH motif-containing putative peptide modification protein [Sulfobacillus sp. hq2]POB12154.1 hypothetical protein CO251_00970 [Sulfobacillus sp. hq2]
MPEFLSAKNNERWISLVQQGNLAGLRSIRRILAKYTANQNMVRMDELIALCEEDISARLLLSSSYFSRWISMMATGLMKRDLSRVVNLVSYAHWFYALVVEGGKISTIPTLTIATRLHEDAGLKREDVLEAQRETRLLKTFSLGARQNPWLEDYVSELNQRDPIPPYPKDIIGLIPYDDETVQALNRALVVIKNSSDTFYDDCLTFLKEIVVVDCKYTANFTDKAFFGVIFLSANFAALDGANLTAERIIHEVGHIKLNAIMVSERLHFAPADIKLKSPLRRDPRPVDGVLHAAYTFARISRFWASLTPHHDQRYEAVCNIVNQCIDQLSTVDHYLTDAGRRLLDEIHGCSATPRTEGL